MGSGDNTLPMKASAASDSLQAGQLFGRYLIVDRVGAGGVGEVYAAYDPSLDRRIALKVMREGPDDEASSQGAAGLVREAKALASLSHPNVVTVHEVGQEDDRVYVAMELVDGRDLEQWIGENAQRPWQVTLDVFMDAGRGLAAAHDRGILHRDFKPANVLIGHDDWVRVSDFGLATLRSGDDRLAMSLAERDLPLSSIDASMTLQGGMVGTPYYMAPEQIDGNATVRSDIYAFCLALHDALYGKRAFEATSFLELATLKSASPPKEPDDARGVPAVVRSAIERGLRPNAEERWPSMEVLLEELRQALKPPTRSALPWLLGLGGIAAGAAVMAQGGSPSCTGAADALQPTWNSTRRSAVTQGIEDSNSPIAAETASRLGPKLDAYSEAWTEAHTRVCEATQRGEQSTALLDQRMTCLQRQLLDFDAALDVLEHADAQVVSRAIRVANALPQPPSCESEIADPNAPETSPAIEDARAERARITALLAAGKYAEAELRSAALLEAAADLGAPRFLGQVLFTQGDALYENGRLDAAIETLERAAFQGVAFNAPNLVLRAATELTVVEGDAGHPEAGLRWSRLAAASIEATGSRPSDLAIHHANRASTLARRGDYAAAEVAIRKALEFREAVTEQQQTTLLQTLAGVLFYQAQYEEAVELQNEAVTRLRAALGPKHPVVALALYNLGTFHTAQGKFADGDAYLRQALEIQEHTLGPEHTDVADTLNSLGASEYQQGKIAEALAAMKRAKEIKSHELSPDHPQVLDASVNVAVLTLETGDLDGSAAILLGVLRRIEAAEDTPAMTESSARFNLGRVRQRQDRLHEAKVLYERALEIDEARLGPDDPRLATLLMGLGILRKRQGEPSEALALYLRALAIQEPKLEPNHPSILAAVNNIASTHLLLDDAQAAKDMAKRLLALSDEREDYAARATFLLAQAHLAAGEPIPALRKGREALKLHRNLPELAEDLAEVEAFVQDLDKHETG